MKNIKKILALILCITTVFVCFTACNTTPNPATTAQGEQTTEAPKGTKLTVDNIEDYVELNGIIKAGSTSSLYEYNGKFVTLYNNFECSMKAVGNSHYKYENVTIKIRFWHATPLSNGDAATETTVTLKLNLAGNGDVSCTLKTPARIASDNGKEITPLLYTFYSSKGMSSSLDTTYYEIVEVTGMAAEY